MSEIRVGVIDYHLSNLRSVTNALSVLGVPAELTQSPDRLDRFTHLILPGVGTFGAGIQNLRVAGLEAALRNQAGHRPILGICLGMQLLASEGDEFGPNRGLDLVPGRVVRLPDRPGLRVPHIGWNSVTLRRESPLFHGIPDGTSFYFVHSYVAVGVPAEYVTATCEYGSDQVIAVERARVYGVQFHPEKSHTMGLHVLRNFIEQC
mgnify:CR=1 FL=1